MKKAFKCHPLMIFRFITPVLFIPTVPVIKAALEYFIVGNTKNFIALEIFALISVILIGFSGLKNYKIEMTEKSVIIKYGFIIRKRACISRKDIAAFKTSRNIIDAVFRSVTCEISTEAGSGKQAEFIFKLYERDAALLEKELYSGEKGKKIKFTLLKRILMVASKSSFITGLAISIPIIKRVEALLGGAINEKIADNITETAKGIKVLLPPIVKVGAIVVILFFVFSFVIFLFRYILFEVEDKGKTLSVKNGFFVRNKTSFKKEKIIAVQTYQTPLLRIFRLCSISASVGGFKNEKGKSGELLPCVSKANSKARAKLVCNLVRYTEKSIETNKTIKTKNRFLFKPLILSVIILGITFWLCYNYNSFRDFALSFLAISMSFVLYYANLCESAFFQSYFGVGEKTVSAMGIEGLNLKEINCKKENIGEIKITRLLPDIWHKTCKVRITAHSKQAPSVKVINLDYKKTKEMISKV